MIRLPEVPNKLDDPISMRKFLTSVRNNLKSASTSSGAVTVAYGTITGLPQLAVGFAPVAGQFLKSYNSGSGLFTAAQAAYADLSGLPQLAVTKAAVSHKFLTAYDAVTGLFTNGQPAYADITGTPQLAITKARPANQFLTAYDATTGLFSTATIALADLPSTGAGGTLFTDTCSPSGQLLPAIVQSVISAGITGLVLPGVVAGHLLVVAFGCEGTMAPTGVSDNHSGVWTKIVEQTGVTNVSMWYSIAGSSASYTITATAGSSTFSHIVGVEIVNAQKVVDGTPTGTINSSTTQTLSTTTTTVGDLLLSAIDAFHSAAIFTLPFPWTLIKQMNGSDALAIGYAISHGPGAKTVLWGGNSLDNCANVLAAVKASTGGTDYSAVGNNGDIFINLANGDLYKRITGAWVYQLSIQTPLL